MGRELGGGELEYAGPAQRSEKLSSTLKEPSFPKSSSTFSLAGIGIGLLFVNLFNFFDSSERELTEEEDEGDLGDNEGENALLTTGGEKDLSGGGVGSKPDPD